MSYSAEDRFLFGGGASASFDTIGTTVSGKIVDKALVQQKDLNTGELKTWQDGSPQMQLVITVETGKPDPTDPDDDGVRKFYCKGNMKVAVAKAVRAAHADGLEVGGTLSITYTGDGVPSKRGFNPPKEYEAVYRSPVDTELHAGGGGSAAAAPASAAPSNEDKLAAAGIELTPETLAALKALQGN